MDKTYPKLETLLKLYPHAEYHYVTATTNGEHAKGSYHGRGEAIDIGCGNQPASIDYLKADHTNRWDQMNFLAAWLWERRSLITELVHTQHTVVRGWYVKNGVSKPWTFYGLPTALAHRNHNHLAVATDAYADKLITLAFQQATGLVQDGIRGPNTMKEIGLIQRSTGNTVDYQIGPQTAAGLRKYKGWRAL